MLTTKPTIAWDFDDVLVDCTNAWVKWANSNGYGPITRKSFKTYDLRDTLKVSTPEYKKILESFFISNEFINIKPRLGMIQIITKLTTICDHIIITGRPQSTTQITHNTIKNNFSTKIKKCHMVGTDPLNYELSTKWQICVKEGCNIIIEDAPFHAKTCAEHGIFVIMPKQPWNQNFSHKNIIKTTKNTDIEKIIKNHLIGQKLQNAKQKSNKRKSL